MEPLTQQDSCVKFVWQEEEKKVRLFAINRIYLDQLDDGRCVVPTSTADVTTQPPGVSVPEKVGERLIGGSIEQEDTITTRA